MVEYYLTGEIVDVADQIVRYGGSDRQVEAETLEPDFDELARRPFVGVEIAT